MLKAFSINNKLWGYIVISLFIILNSYLIYRGFFYFGMVSVLLAFLYIVFIRLDTFLFLIVFLTPLSISITKIKYGFENDLILPTEPMIIIVLIVFFLKLLYEKSFDKKVLKHPITIVIFFNLTWIFLTSITSTMPLVSFKYLIARIWFIVAFYFLATQLFYKYKNLEKYLWLYIIPMVIVIIYCIIKQNSIGISDQQAANKVPIPFFNDHTAYGASLAMLYPVLVHFLFLRNKSLLYKVVIFLLFILFTAAIVFSYTRATWLSIAAGLAIYVFIKFQIKFRYLLLLSIVGIFFIYSSWSSILIELERNKTESSDYLMEHVKSMSNVTSDASNLERFNRWFCAIRMFKEKPVLGWGPGTYKFKYAPFQLSYQKTIISTNAGILGNAHSEYIGPLAEMGILGSITFLLIIIYTIIHSLRLYRNLEDEKTKSLVLALFIGLLTYYFHGILNNFLDTDKASVLFWGYTAAIVALELYHKDKMKKPVKN